jgi:hypothetical protein
MKEESKKELLDKKHSHTRDTKESTTESVSVKDEDHRYVKEVILIAISSYHLIKDALSCFSTFLILIKVN